MKYAISYIAFIVSFFVIDSIWISQVVIGLYEQEISHLMAEQTNVVAAVLFYTVYAAGTLFLCRRSIDDDALGATFINGAVAGGLAYGTYAFTNFAVLEKWTLLLVSTDIAWGILVTGLCASISLLARRIFVRA